MNHILEKYLISENAFTLLNVLKKGKNKWQLPAELANSLKVRREALFEAVDELDKVGYPLEIHPYFGLRLIGLPNSFIPGEITDNLNVSLIGKSLKLMKKTPSAVKEAFKLIQKGESEDGMVIIADENTETKTWKDHDWFSPAENGVCIAIVLKLPMLTPDKKDLLLAVGTLAAAYTLTDNIHIPARIVYPGEIYVYNRKIGAVLIEQNDEFPDHYVLAININVNTEVDDFPTEFVDKATSVKMELGEETNRNSMLRYLLFSLDNFVNKLRKRKFKALTELWLDYSALINKANNQGNKVVVNTEATQISGIVKELDPIKGLTIKISDTEDKTLHKNEIKSLKFEKA